jgi:hypothetical protein
VRVVFALKRSISCDMQTPSMILNWKKHKQSHNHQKMGPEREFYDGRQRTKQTDRQPRIVIHSINWISRWLILYQVPVSKRTASNKYSLKVLLDLYFWISWR